MPARAALPVVPAESARRLLLAGQQLRTDPTRRATPAGVRKTIERMGFVQVDTINVVDRAHHHILRSRFDDYQPRMLTKLLERDRALFEHWTHDASIIPATWFREWRVRCARYRRHGHSPNGWWRERMGGEPERVIPAVLERVRREGPMMSRDFEDDRPAGANAWWGWRPAKCALEFLWRSGELSVAARVNFHKVYDLTERVYPDLHAVDVPSEDEHLDWACRAALDRLGVATGAELAAFLDAVPLKAATAWGHAAVERGDALPVMVESVDGSAPRRAFAHPQWRRRAARGSDAPDRIRILSPFDPVIRDRRRAKRLFDFDYRFEAFVPAAKRKHGYYVMPLLERDRLVGRLDAKLHRDRGVLEVKGLWWEPGIKLTRTRRAALHAALDRFAAGLGADDWTLPRSSRR
jgi:uncharacterized protein YcaQ